MNPKIEKLEKEIDKTKNKIAEMQARLRDLENRKRSWRTPTMWRLPAVSI